MSDEGTWRVLKRPQKSNGLFLAKWQFHESRYGIYVTNLSQIWAEQLDLRGIVRRAKKNKCSIDPSEDVQQRQKLFEKLASALSQDENTSLNLKVDDVRDTITLELTIPLPAQLSDIHWQAELSLLEEDALGKHVTLPVITALHQRNEEVSQLKSALKNKDQVLGRLLDRLESSGTDLATVFPGTAAIKSSRKVSRAQVARYVRGLEPFEQSTWQPTLTALSSTADLTAALSDISAQESDTLAVGLGLSPDTKEETSANADRGFTGHSKVDDHEHEPETESEDSEFQIQTSPSKGDKVATLNSPEPSAARSPSPRKDTGGTTSPRKGKGRLGRIGGGKAGEVPEMPRPLSSNSRESTREPSEPAASAPATPKKSKIGVIGKRRDRAAGSGDHAGDDQPKASTAPDQPSPTNDQTIVETDRQRKDIHKAEPLADPEWSAEEAANKRRAEVKQQLATQASAPAKKKRRF